MAKATKKNNKASKRAFHRILFTRILSDETVAKRVHRRYGDKPFTVERNLEKGITIAKITA